ncbi:MAG: transporter substrate-binding domain-containing protein [Pseudomonadota bacterium]
MQHPAHAVICRALLALSALLWPLSGMAQTPPGDCPVHTVARGETLGTIAAAHLGNRERAFEIYEQNQSIIGENPDIIEVGMPLTLPCTPTPVASPAPEPTPVEEPAPTPVAEAAPRNTGISLALGRPGGVRLDDLALRPTTTEDTPPQTFHLLAGAPFSPYVDREVPGQGLAHLLIEAAFDQNPGATAQISAVADRPAHLTAILPRGGFQLSFPWVYPDCDLTNLSTEEALLCTDYLPSDSFYEQLTEFFARADGQWAAARTPQDLIGARMCRPAGYPTHDLTRLGLLPDAIMLYRPAQAGDCLAALDQGNVDVATLDATLARALVDTVPVRNALIVLEDLTQIDRLHAIALRGDSQAAAALAAFNTGLAELINSGAWFEIVDTHMRPRLAN